MYNDRVTKDCSSALSCRVMRKGEICHEKSSETTEKEECMGTFELSGAIFCYL